MSESVTSLQPYFGSLTDTRYQQMCRENGGEEGLWRLYSEEYKKQIPVTDSSESATTNTTLILAAKFGIQTRESTYVHRHLRNQYGSAKK